jgi:hypothetical protein
MNRRILLTLCFLVFGCAHGRVGVYYPTLTPNLGLAVPQPGVTPGCTYNTGCDGGFAPMISNDLNLIDAFAGNQLDAGSSGGFMTMGNLVTGTNTLVSDVTIQSDGLLMMQGAVPPGSIPTITYAAGWLTTAGNGSYGPGTYTWRVAITDRVNYCFAQWPCGVGTNYVRPVYAVVVSENPDGGTIVPCVMTNAADAGLQMLAPTYPIWNHNSGGAYDGCAAYTNVEAMTVGWSF